MPAPARASGSSRGPPTQGLVGNARSPGNNRSVSVAGDRVFMQTDSAHLIALNRFTGQVLWDTEMADYRQNYNATGSMLAVENLVVAGHRRRRAGRARLSGGLRPGHRQRSVALLDHSRARRARFGDLGRQRHRSRRRSHLADRKLRPRNQDRLLAHRQRRPRFQRRQSQGRQPLHLLDPGADLATGKLKWHYQTTPHDEWDWDAVQPLVLVDANWQGKPRKLLLQANRNGFFYVLDRTDGKLLLAKPLVKKLTWAKEIGADGRPVMNPNQTPDRGRDKLVCPRWRARPISSPPPTIPATGLFYVNTLERCNVYHQDRPRPSGAQAADIGAAAAAAPRTRGAEDSCAPSIIQTGKVVWEMPQEGDGESLDRHSSPPPADWSSTATMAAHSAPPMPPPAKSSGASPLPTRSTLRP